jgi:hypothetical protein
MNIHYLEGDCADDAGNRMWDLSTTQNTLNLINKIIELSDNSIIFLPFDQSPGILMRLLGRPDVRKDICKVFSFNSRRRLPISPYICVHIRRGDCTKERHPLWYIENSFYENLFATIIQCVPNSFHIAVCTQGDTTWIEQFAKKLMLDSSRLSIYTTNQLFINDAEVDDFVLMLKADCLIGAGSSFSRWAAVLGEHKIVFDACRYPHFLGNVIQISPELNARELYNVVSSSFARIWPNG